MLLDLEASIEECEAEIEVDSLPAIDADAAQLRQLFQNLISNGLKFRRADVRPWIRIAGTASDRGPDYCRIVVSDNGIGFESSQAERIFTIFQRLHGRSEYEGTGIGLSIVRKIVDRHHGSIEAKGRPGQGAEFIIDLPLRLSPTPEDKLEVS